MHIFDVLEAWFHSMKTIFDASSIIAKFDRSPTDRSNPSCCLNLRHKNQELDLVVWDSGGAEFVTGDVNGAIRQIHFDDIRNPSGLLGVFSELVQFVNLNSP